MPADARLSKEPPSSSDRPVLSVRGITKSFGATKALDDVVLDLYSGQIAGLVGDNGAGKSTLVKSIVGVLQPDAGTITYHGEPRSFANALSARIAGIETVHQDLALCDNLTVYQNIFLGRELEQSLGRVRFLAKRSMRRKAAQIFEERLGVPALPLKKRTNQLSGGQRQLVALARAEAWEAEVMLLDEPTAALSAEAVGHVVEVMRKLQQRGVALLIISHNLPQVIELTDRIVVLRQGRNVATLDTRDASPRLLLGLMTGMITPEELNERLSS
jgi:D-xylose transport system ATP-binding protein